MCELFLICHSFLKRSTACQQLTAHICLCCSSLWMKLFQKKHLWLPKAGTSRNYLRNTKLLFLGFTDRADTPFTVSIKWEELEYTFLRLSFLVLLTMKVVPRVYMLRTHIELIHTIVCSRNLRKQHRVSIHPSVHLSLNSLCTAK